MSTFTVIKMLSKYMYTVVYGGAYGVQDTVATRIK